MRRFGRSRPPQEITARAGLARGEKVLASAAAADGCYLLGTRDALLVVDPVETRRVPWQQVETADWDRDEERLRVVEVGEFGRPKPVHTFTVTDPGPALTPLLGLVRERVTASVLLQRRVLLRGKQGLTVVARRPPSGDGPVVWATELDPGLSPDDPEVRRAADEAVRATRDELGPGA